MDGNDDGIENKFDGTGPIQCVPCSFGGNTPKITKIINSKVKFGC